MRVGLVHVHSDYSRDGHDSLERLRDIALERKISFLALTDHAEDFETELFDEYRGHCASLSDERVRLIPGLEFRFRTNAGLHLLALDLKRLSRPRTPEAFIAEMSGSAGMTLVAHPVLADYRIPTAVAERIDGVEVWNASYDSPLVPDPRAIRLLHSLRERRPTVVGIAGADQHDASQDAGTRVILDTESADPVEDLIAGRFTNVGRTMRFGSEVSLTSSRLRTIEAARWTVDRVGRTRRWLVGASRRMVIQCVSPPPSSRS
ncbi:MAG: PHP domain-containing protein [Gemmatimonadaceae bacterium]